MKKQIILWWLAWVLCTCFWWLYSSAEYQIQINTWDVEVYISSWDTKITLDNVDKYMTGLNEELILPNEWSITSGSSDSWDAVTNTWSTETWNISTETATNTGSTISEDITSSDSYLTWNTTNSWAVTSTWNIRILGDNVFEELTSGTEFEQALYRMYKNWLTKYDNESDFRPYDNLTREESAKMIGQLYSQLWFEKTDKWFNCSFVDTNLFNPTLAEHIYNVCRRGIFRWNDKTQQYMPHDNLTKWQLLAVLLRIFEWKLSDESLQPRWIQYYVKALKIGLTNETNLAKFNQPVSRRESALLIYRFKNMVIDSNQYDLYLWRLDSLAEWWENFNQEVNDLSSQWAASQNNNSDKNSETSNLNQDSTNPDSNAIISWTGDAMTWSSISLDIIAWNQALTEDPEFVEAINWMFDMGMTSYNTTESFMPYQTITRAQVAKMLDKFATATNLTTIRNLWVCEFSDVDSNAEYKDSITKMCQYWVMVWSNDKFKPDQIVSKAEFISMLIRLFDGQVLDETLSPRWTAYYKRAIEIWLIWAQDTVTFTSNIARYEVATYLYRLKVRLTMYNNLNSSQLSDEIIKTIEETTVKDINDKVSSKIYIDVVALNNTSVTDWYAEILWERYKVKLTSNTSYNIGNNSFVRYATLNSLESWDSVWNVTLILTNGAFTEWTIRINNKTYYINKDLNTTTYYNLVQK